MNNGVPINLTHIYRSIAGSIPARVQVVGRLCGRIGHRTEVGRALAVAKQKLVCCWCAECGVVVMAGLVDTELGLAIDARLTGVLV